MRRRLLPDGYFLFTVEKAEGDGFELGPKRRWRHSEAYLRGKVINDESINYALEILLRDVQFRTSPHRATSDYRRELAKTLFQDTFNAAWKRALD